MPNSSVFATAPFPNCVGRFDVNYDVGVSLARGASPSAEVMASMEGFVGDKPVLAVRFHRFQSNSVVDQLFEFEKTVDTYKAGKVPLEEIPMGVVTPEDNEMRKGSHWKLYPGNSMVKACSG